ncbi:MAG: biotin--[acetyl-CoA-carboxylase] ligase [Lachnospiraceae bacterium]|nr:biotin--[acetyl-CoA-carboxylase] ligase [Lachnospiraceae bacterium]
MSVKDKALEFFEKSKGVYVSGEKLAKELGVTRSSVFKAVKALREEEYKIEAVPSKGYCFLEGRDILSVSGIKKYLLPELKDMDINVYASLPSTNLLLNEMAASSGADEGKVVISKSQTGGKGRRGRTFFSPPNTGIYLSILLMPRLSAEESVFITTAAAVAVCRAVEKVSGRIALIKWVNDVLLDGKKICGILTEASVDMESGNISYAVLGIGINVYEPPEGFPDEIKNIAGSIFKNRGNDMLNKIAAGFLNEFMGIYARIEEDKSFTEEYKKRSLALGKHVSVLLPKGETLADVLDIDDSCHLVVRYMNGKRETLSSGEISIRL